RDRSPAPAAGDPGAARRRREPRARVRGGARAHRFEARQPGRDRRRGAAGERLGAGRSARAGARGRARPDRHWRRTSARAAANNPHAFGRTHGGDGGPAGSRERHRGHAAPRGRQRRSRARAAARSPLARRRHGAQPEPRDRRARTARRVDRPRRALFERRALGSRAGRLFARELQRNPPHLGQGPGTALRSVVHEAFAADGALAARIPGFRHRAGQLEMALAIHEAIEQCGVLIAEAGTGTGKTFAYLVPALLSGGKVLVSTGTKTLQDQLFDRDLPAVREALSLGTSLALLKGRANYVCLYRLRRAAQQGLFGSREEAAQIARIERFAAGTVAGERSDLADVPEDAPVWSHATSTRENCLGQECPDYKDCFVMRARRNALTADVVVVNHHLFFADVALRDEGVAELLPACNTVI